MKDDSEVRSAEPLDREVDQRRGGPDHKDADTVIVAARRAYPMYLEQSAYVCQAGRGFASGLDYLGFYHDKQIHPEIPRILGRFDQVEITDAEADLRHAQGELGSQVARVIRWILARSKHAQAYAVGSPCQIFVLTPPSSPQTLILPAPIRHAKRSAWTQNQRYTHSALLLQQPKTTTDLERLQVAQVM